MLFLFTAQITKSNMKINSIEIENYRNIEKAKLSFDDVNIIYGENAQGKTNLIEAIYLFTGAKSFRGAKDAETVRFGCDFARLKIEFEGKDRLQEATLVIKNRRQATLNGIKKTSPSALGDEVKAVVFSPAHLSMVKDGPAERRKFIDTALCQIKSGYKKLLSDYNRCLVQRNILLKDIGDGKIDPDMLCIWNRNIVKTGAKIIYQRAKYIEALQKPAEEIHFGLSGDREKIGLSITGSFEPKGMSLEEIESALSEKMQEAQKEDMYLRATTVGPHRDDLEITINGFSARKYGSQGQQRSCVLSLKLAEAEILSRMTGDEPIALLDDVMSELDETRQDYILNHMKNRQIFITCCDANTVLRLKEGKTFHIENGGIA